jgi:hypothetical protein
VTGPLHGVRIVETGGDRSRALRGHAARRPRRRRRPGRPGRGGTGAGRAPRRRWSGCPATAARSPSTSRPSRASRWCGGSWRPRTSSSRDSAPGSPNGWGSDPDDLRERATRGWSTPGPPGGGRRARSRPGPGTTSTTPPSPARSTPSGGRRPAATAGQLPRRLRWRWHVPRDRGAGRARRARPRGRGRWSTPRWSTVPRRRPPSSTGCSAARRLDRPSGAGNLLDGAAPFYDTYPARTGGSSRSGRSSRSSTPSCARGSARPGRVAPARPGVVAGPEGPARRDLATRDRDEWAEVFAGTDACVAPGAVPDRGARPPPQRRPGTFVEVDGVPAARSGTAVVADPGRGRATTADPRRAHRRGAGRPRLRTRTRIAALRAGAPSPAEPDHACRHSGGVRPTERAAASRLRRRPGSGSVVRSGSGSSVLGRLRFGLGRFLGRFLGRVPRLGSSVGSGSGSRISTHGRPWKSSVMSSSTSGLRVGVGSVGGRRRRSRRGTAPPRAPARSRRRAALVVGMSVEDVGEEPVLVRLGRRVANS